MFPTLRNKSLGGPFFHHVFVATTIWIAAMAALFSIWLETVERSLEYERDIQDGYDLRQLSLEN